MVAPIQALQPTDPMDTLARAQHMALAPQQMEIMRQRAATENRQAQMEFDQKKMAYVSQVARALVSKMQNTGLQPGTPQFQQELERSFEPFKPILQQVTGHPGGDMPLDWQNVTSMAQMQPIGTNAPHVAGFQTLYDEQNNPTAYAIDSTGQMKALGRPAPKTSPNLQITGGVAQPIPGAPQAMGALAGAEEQAKQGQRIFNTKDGEGRDRFFRGAQVQAPMAPEAPGDVPTMDFADPAQALNDARKMPPGPDRDRLVSALTKSQVTGQPFDPNQAGQSTADKATQEAQAKATVDLQKDNQEAAQKKERGAKEVLSILNTPIDGKKVDDLIKESTHSLVGNIVDSAAGAFGATTQGADAASALQTISGWLTANVPRMEGPQSNYDVENYKTMAADIGNPKIPVQQRIKKLHALRAMMGRYGAQDDYAAKNSAPSESASPKRLKFNPATGRLE